MLGKFKKMILDNKSTVFKVGAGVTFDWLFFSYLSKKI